MYGTISRAIGDANARHGSPFLAVLVINNRSSIDRYISVSDAGHNHEIFMPRNSYWELKYNPMSACWWIDDKAAGLRYDIIGGTSGKTDRHMTIDLHDHKIIHHGETIDHGTIRISGMIAKIYHYRN
jgi:hypothetical protein